MLDRLLQGQDLMEEGALEHWLEQAELLLSGHFSPLLEFGLESLHRLQGTLRVCKPSHVSVTAPEWRRRCRQPEVWEWQRWREVERGGEDKDFISSWVKIARVGRVFGYYLIYSFRHPDLIIERILLKKSLHNHLKHDFNIFMFNNNSMTCKCIG